MPSTTSAQRNATAKTVGRQQAASLGRRKAQQAKQAENAAKVTDLTERRRQADKAIDQATAEHGVGRYTRTECITYLQAHGAYSGHSRDSVEQLREAVRHHRSTSSTPEAPNPEAEPVVPPQPDATPDVPAEPEADRQARLKAAKAEHKLLQQWIADGSNPPRPPTPNLDALEAEANGSKPKAKAKATSARSARTHGHPRYAEAIAAKKAKARTGRGNACTDDQLRIVIDAERAQHPEASRTECMEVAYWLGGLAFSRARWNAAWEAATK